MWRTLGYVFIFVGMQLLVSSVFELVYQKMGSGAVMMSDPAWLSGALSVSSVLTVLLLVACRMLPSKRFVSADLSARDWLCASAMTLLLIVPLNTFSDQALPSQMEAIFERMMHHPLGVLNLALLGPLVEELVFRAGIQNYLQQRKFHPALCIVISSGFFSVVHGNLAQIPAAFLMGLFLGWLYWKRSSWGLTWAVHALNNTLAVISCWCFGADFMIQDHISTGGLIALDVVLLLMFVLLFRRYARLLRQG